MTPSTALLFVAAFAGGVAAGGMLVYLVGILPLRSRMGAAPFLQVHLLSSPRIDRVIPPGIVLSGLAALLAAAAGGLGPRAALAAVLGAAGAGIVSAISLAVHRPLNGRLRALSEGGAGPELAGALDRWRRFHALRTAAALLAFAAYVVAALAASGRP
jgi:hypothetical protein